MPVKLCPSCHHRPSMRTAEYGATCWCECHDVADAAPDLLVAAKELKAAFLDGCGNASHGPKHARLVKAGAALDAAIDKAERRTP